MFLWKKTMGNYLNIEYEFIDKTMKLISQYDDILKTYPFEEQYNYTPTISCLLGLVVMSKERVVSYIPKNRLTTDFKKQLGLEISEIGEDIKTLRDLIQKLRNSITDFNINVISEDEQSHIAWLEFRDYQDGERVIAKIRANEIIPFLQYYSTCLLKNLERYAH